MRSVHSILSDKKSQEVHCIDHQAPVIDALKLMAKINIGALVVTQNNKAIGIMSERDYARKIALKGLSSLDTPVSDIMSSNLITVGPDSTLEECMSIMTQKHFRHLPVMKDGHLLGVLSIGDLVKEQLKEQQFAIEQMNNYITGQYSVLS